MCRRSVLPSNAVLVGQNVGIDVQVGPPDHARCSFKLAHQLYLVPWLASRPVDRLRSPGGHRRPCVRVGVCFRVRVQASFTLTMPKLAL
jgi:hypothetical protein